MQDRQGRPLDRFSQLRVTYYVAGPDRAGSRVAAPSYTYIRCPYGDRLCQRLPHEATGSVERRLPAWAESACFDCKADLLDVLDAKVDA